MIITYLIRSIIFIFEYILYTLLSLDFALIWSLAKWQWQEGIYANLDQKLWTLTLALVIILLLLSWAQPSPFGACYCTSDNGNCDGYLCELDNIWNYLNFNKLGTSVWDVFFLSSFLFSFELWRLTLNLDLLR